MSLIVIDPGHGGEDPGAVANGMQEKELNLNIALEMKNLLDKAGLSVLLTREQDETLSLGKRVAIANNEKASLFLSVHCNASTNPLANGLEVFHYPQSSSGKKFATSLSESLLLLGRKMRGVSEEKFYVLKHSHMPACLVECGFITNPEEGVWIKSHISEIAEALAQGIRNWEFI